MGVTYLLDTHAVIWLVGTRRRPRDAVLEALEDADSTVLVSAVSAFEVATKVRLGKLDHARELAHRWEGSMARLGVIPLDLNAAHGALAGNLAWDHRDPFDRLLAAQALLGDLVLVTADPVFDTAPDLSLLRW